MAMGGVVAIPLSLSFNSGCIALAKWLGYSEMLVLALATAMLGIVTFAWLAWRLYPVQGVAVIYRSISSLVWMFGVVGVCWSARHIPYNEWMILSVSLHLLMVLLLTIQFAWVARKYPAPPWKPIKRELDDWSS